MSRERERRLEQGFGREPDDRLRRGWDAEIEPLDPEHLEDFRDRLLLVELQAAYEHQHYSTAYRKPDLHQSEGTRPDVWGYCETAWGGAEFDHKVQRQGTGEGVRERQRRNPQPLVPGPAPLFPLPVPDSQTDLKALISGIWEGFGAGVADTLKSAKDLLDSIVSGEIISQVQEIAHFLLNLNAEQVKAIAQGLGKQATDTLASWNDQDVAKASQARGEFIGYVLAQVALTVLTAGAANVARSAKVAQLVERIPGVKGFKAGVEKLGLHTNRPGEPRLAGANGPVSEARANPQTVPRQGGAANANPTPALSGEFRAAFRNVQDAIKAEWVYSQFANWPQLRILIGKPFTQTPPAGYHYGQIAEAGRKVEFYFLEQTEPDKVPLFRNYNGKVSVPATEKPTARIADLTDYRENYRRAHGGFLLQNNQIHHLFADNVWRRNEFLRSLLKDGLESPNAPKNLIEMATNDTPKPQFQQVLRDHPDRVSSVIHDGDHKLFDDLAERILDRSVDVYRARWGPWAKWTDDQKRQVYAEALRQIRELLMNPPRNLPRKRDGTLGDLGDDREEA